MSFVDELFILMQKFCINCTIASLDVLIEAVVEALFHLVSLRLILLKNAELVNCGLFLLSLFC